MSYEQLQEGKLTLSAACLPHFHTTDATFLTDKQSIKTGTFSKDKKLTLSTRMHRLTLPPYKNGKILLKKGYPTGSFHPLTL